MTDSNNRYVLDPINEEKQPNRVICILLFTLFITVFPSLFIVSDLILFTQNCENCFHKNIFINIAIFILVCLITKWNFIGLFKHPYLKKTFKNRIRYNEDMSNVANNKISIIMFLVLQETLIFMLKYSFSYIISNKFNNNNNNIMIPVSIYFRDCIFGILIMLSCMITLITGMSYFSYKYIKINFLHSIILVVDLITYIFMYLDVKILNVWLVNFYLAILIIFFHKLYKHYCKKT